MQRREADQEQKHRKQAATRGASRVANQQTTATRRALEWTRLCNSNGNYIGRYFIRSG